MTERLRIANGTVVDDNDTRIDSHVEYLTRCRFDLRKQCRCRLIAGRDDR